MRGNQRLLNAIRGAQVQVEFAGKECRILRQHHTGTDDAKIFERMRVLLLAQHSMLEMFRGFLEGCPTLER